MMKNITPRKFGFSEIEKKHILKSWVAVSLAFAIAFSPYPNFMTSLIVSALTIGFAFVLHEVAHKYLAIKYRCNAEFRANNNMLVLMLIVSLFGIIFAAPGAVQISGHVTKDKYGKIALAGPMTNLVLALIFLVILLSGLGNFSLTLFRFGFLINAWIALFNMIPLLGFDGHKILSWNKNVFYAVLIASILLVSISQYL